MFDCTTEDYDRLYARWLAHPGALLTHGGYVAGEKLLDLCGGSGAVSREALRWNRDKADASQTPDVTLFDLNPRAGWAEGPFRRGQFRTVQGNAEEVDTHFAHGIFDLIVCRQAVAYFDYRKAFPAVAKLLRPGGRFAFNYFVHPLEGEVKRYSTHLYQMEGVRFAEAHLYLWGKVYHLQARLNRGPGVDFSVFQYHDPEDMAAVLADAGFDLAILREGRSLRFLCIKKETP